MFVCFDITVYLKEKKWARWNERGTRWAWWRRDRFLKNKSSKQVKTRANEWKTRPPSPSVSISGLGWSRTSPYEHLRTGGWSGRVEEKKHMKKENEGAQRERLGRVGVTRLLNKKEGGRRKGKKEERRTQRRLDGVFCIHQYILML